MAEFNNTPQKNYFDESKDFCLDYITSLPVLYEMANYYSAGVWNKYDYDVGDAMIKMLATCMHVIDYYYHRYINALVLPNDDWTSKSLIWELTGYKPPYIRADYLMVQLYWPGCVNTAYVPIYMYTPFEVSYNGNVYKFMAAKDYLVPPMTSKINITLVQGELQKLTPDKDKVVVDENRIKLSDTPIDYDLVSVFISGVKWKQVRNVFYEFNTERVFSLHREEDGIWLYFHESWTKYIDDYNKEFEVYFVSSDESYTDYIEDCVDISISGTLLDTNGVDVTQNYRIFPMPQHEIPSSIIPVFQEDDRVVTTPDYTNKALLYPGIATAKAYSWNDYEVTKDPYKVNIIALGPNGFLKDRVKVSLCKYLEAIGSPSITVEVLDPIFVKYNILVTLDIGEYAGTITETEILLLLKAELKKIFAYGNFRPGDTITTKQLNAKLIKVDDRIIYIDTVIDPQPFQGPFYVPMLGTFGVNSKATSIVVSDTVNNPESNERIAILRPILLREYYGFTNPLGIPADDRHHVYEKEEGEYNTSAADDMGGSAFIIPKGGEIALFEDVIDIKICYDRKDCGTLTDFPAVITKKETLKADYSYYANFGLERNFADKITAKDTASIVISVSDKASPYKDLLESYTEPEGSYIDDTSQEEWFRSYYEASVAGTQETAESTEVILIRKI